MSPVPHDPSDPGDPAAPDATNAAEGWLCPCCVTPNPALAHFCARCGGPLSPLASTDPFKQTLAEGFAIRRAVDGPVRPIVVAGLWLLFLPGLAGLPIAWLDGVRGDPLTQHGVVSLLSAVIPALATRNYLRHRRAAADKPDEADEPDDSNAVRTDDSPG